MVPGTPFLRYRMEAKSQVRIYTESMQLESRSGTTPGSMSCICATMRWRVVVSICFGPGGVVCIGLSGRELISNRDPGMVTKLCEVVTTAATCSSSSSCKKVVRFDVEKAAEG